MKLIETFVDYIIVNQDVTVKDAIAYTIDKCPEEYDEIKEFTDEQIKDFGSYNVKKSLYLRLKDLKPDGSGIFKTSQLKDIDQAVSTILDLIVSHYIRSKEIKNENIHS